MKIKNAITENCTKCSRYIRELCSWKCVLAYLPKIKSDYFASLPYLHFDAGYPKEMTAKELIRLLGKK